MKEETLIKQCIYDSCTDLKEINKLISYFENLQKENEQLKEEKEKFMETIIGTKFYSGIDIMNLINELEGKSE